MIKENIQVTPSRPGAPHVKYTDVISLFESPDNGSNLSNEQQ